MKDAIILMMAGSHGVYIPKNFVNDVNLNDWHVSQDDAAILTTGPDHDAYWDVWTDVLDSAYYMDGNNKYTLHQDGDLWAICAERMSNEEYENFFDEMKPAPADAYEYEVCSDCLIALANNDYSGMDDDQARAVESGLAALHQQYKQVIPDGAEYGFSHNRCECCDALPDERFRILCFDKVDAS